MNVLFILNDAPYGSERTYNGLRIAGHLAKQEGNTVKLFLIGDAASCAHRNQKVPPGFYNIETMLSALLKQNGAVGICGTCMDARGLGEDNLIEGTHRSTLGELAEWLAWSDRTLVF